VTGRPFPDGTELREIASQFAYAVFQGDLAKPRFSNFASGWDGWHRVGYDKQPGFGYGPSDHSPAGMLGGYGAWRKHNPDIQKINLALWSMVNTADDEVIAFRDEYYAAYWANQLRTYEPMSLSMTDSRDLLQFLPVFGAMR